MTKATLNPVFERFTGLLATTCSGKVAWGPLRCCAIQGYCVLPEQFSLIKEHWLKIASAKDFVENKVLE